MHPHVRMYAVLRAISAQIGKPEGAGRPKIRRKPLSQHPIIYWGVGFCTRRVLSRFPRDKSGWFEVRRYCGDFHFSAGKPIGQCGEGCWPGQGSKSRASKACRYWRIELKKRRFAPMVGSMDAWFHEDEERCSISFGIKNAVALLSAWGRSEKTKIYPNIRYLYMPIFRLRSIACLLPAFFSDDRSLFVLPVLRSALMYVAALRSTNSGCVYKAIVLPAYSVSAGEENIGFHCNFTLLCNFTHSPPSL